MGLLALSLEAAADDDGDDDIFQVLSDNDNAPGAGERTTISICVYSSMSSRPMFRPMFRA